MSGKAKEHIDRLMQRGRDFLNCDLAIMGGAMSWVSEHNLVAAISNAGGFGVLACGSMPPDILDKEIEETLAATSKPFGVNLITLHPQLSELIDICGQRKMTHVVLAGALPSAASIKQIKDYGMKAVAFAPAYIIAKKLIRSGIDALVIEGMEAGGHIGPVSTTVLAQEILPHVKDIPVFVAGGIGHGEAVLSYLEMGAAGVQLGTRFVCATESIAHPNFKQAFIRGEARDATASSQLDPRFPVIPVRALQNEGTKNFMEAQRKAMAKVDAGELTVKEAQLEIEHFWVGALRRAVIEGDVENGSVMAGQSVGMVKKEQSVSEILHELMSEASAAFDRRVAVREAM